MQALYKFGYEDDLGGILKAGRVTEDRADDDNLMVNRLEALRLSSVRPQENLINPNGMVSNGEVTMLVTMYLRWTLKQFDCGNYETIRLVNIAFEEGKGEHDKDFVPFTKNALDLIKATAPRRYRTIVREVHYIANSYIMAGGTYHRGLRRISVNFPLYKIHPSDPDYQRNVAVYACMLVHESTHGRLFSLGIPYNNSTWECCERICNREEKRFISRVVIENCDTDSLVADIDIEYYKSMRQMTLTDKLHYVKGLFSKFILNNNRESGQ
jgi:hypothetical protein